MSAARALATDNDFELGALDADTRIGVDRARSTALPPSYDDIILRRTRSRDKPKASRAPTRYPNLHDAAWQFSGWGETRRVRLTADEVAAGAATIESERPILLHAALTSAVAANDVFASALYAFPALAASSSVYSPLALSIATMLPFAFRPIMRELASALPLRGAAYAYLLNTASKTVAIFAASCALMDFVATSVVSAASAAAYLQGEITVDIPVWAIAAAFIALFTALSLAGLRESTRMALAIVTFHGVTMAMLMLAAVVGWARTGNAVISANWSTGQPGSSTGVARAIFDGVCIGTLGLTGFECAPDYAPICRPGGYRRVLQTLHLGAFVLGGPLLLLVYANVPNEVIVGGDNVLSALASAVAGRWLRLVVVVDAMVVLGAAILTGILSACALFEQLAHDRILPRWLLAQLPVTGAPWTATIAFAAVCAIVYASTGASLSLMSSLFAMTFLFTISIYPVALLTLRFNRDRLPRERSASLALILFTLALSIGLIGGNIALQPVSIGLFAAFVVVVFAILKLADAKASVLQVGLWLLDQTPWLHERSMARKWPTRIIDGIRKLKRQPVVLFVQTDEIHSLIKLVSYVRTSESTSKLELVCCYENETQIPPDLQAVSRILDEAFPTLTIDLVLVQAAFTPPTVAAICHRLGVHRNLAFMTSPGPDSAFSVAELGLRVISL